MLKRLRMRKNGKGQGLTEYVLILAFIASVAFMMFGSEGSLKGTLASTLDSIIEVMESISGKGFDMPAVLARITGQEGVAGIQTHYNSSGHNAGDKNYRRGFVMSTWLNEEDKNNSEIQSIANDLGAVAWVYYNGIIPDWNNNSYLTTDAQGLYWHTESLAAAVTNGELTKNSNKYSNEKVLSYFYNQTTGKYEVVQNHVWMDQASMSGSNGEPALAAITREWNKPAGTVVGSYDTYREAQKAYEQAKANNGGSVIF